MFIEQHTSWVGYMMGYKFLMSTLTSVDFNAFTDLELHNSWLQYCRPILHLE